MGRHKEWRKIAKRERRRRIRKQLARQDEGNIDCSSEEYIQWQNAQEVLELYELEHVCRNNEIENAKWLQADQIAQEQWKKLQEHKERIRLKELEQEIKLRLEWEKEQERKKKEEERLLIIEEENKKKQAIFMQHLEQFLSGDAVEPPQELLISRETKPTCDPCPFFSKTASCRFGDQCSRNHRYPGISKVLLASNFYSHFGLENANDYDADIMLEYEESDTYKEFKEFFYDVIPEFEKFGKIVQFKICNNYEKHLRGNTYIEYAELRCAVAAYRALHTRWYGGRQLSLQFCMITSWKNAICGLQSRKRCPKGRACNFLHVFKNPNNLYNSLRDSSKEFERSRKRTPPRHWRWSESPEPEIRKRRRSRSPDRRYKSKSPEPERRKRRRSRSPDSRNSKSPDLEIRIRRRSRSPDRRNKCESPEPEIRNKRRSRSPDRQNKSESPELEIRKRRRSRSPDRRNKRPTEKDNHRNDAANKGSSSRHHHGQSQRSRSNIKSDRRQS